jgi:hypothetical protein
MLQRSSGVYTLDVVVGDPKGKQHWISQVTADRVILRSSRGLFPFPVELFSDAKGNFQTVPGNSR